MTKTKEGYKETEIGLIPEDWEVSRLENFIIIKHGFAFKGEFFTDNPTRNLLLTPGNFKMGGGFYEKKCKYYSQQAEIPKEFILNSNDLIVTMTDLNKDGGTLGYPAIVPSNERISYLHNQRIGKVVFTSERLYKFYLYYLLCSMEYRKHILSTASGTTVNHTSPTKITEFYFALPNVSEQRRIAEILTTTDNHIEKLDKIIEDYQLLKKGMLKKLLTKGIGHTEFKETEIGRIPKEWEVKTLGEVTEIVSGGTPKTNIAEYWDEGTILWATPTDVTGNRSKYISNTERKISEKGLKNSSANLLPVGTILMTSRATIGERCINTIPMATNQGFKSFICKGDIFNEYLYYYIDLIKDLIILNSSGSTFLEISKGKVEMIKVAIPDISEQQQISEVLSTVDEKIEMLQVEKNDFKLLKESLTEKLLSGKIRVF